MGLRKGLRETQTEISICIIYPEWDDPRIESHDKNLSIYLDSSYFFASVHATKWYSYFWPFHLSSSALPLCPGAILASVQIIRLGDHNHVDFNLQHAHGSGRADQAWRYSLRCNRGLGFWTPPPGGGRCSHRELLLLASMRFHRLNWRQHVHNWGRLALWWKVRWEVERCVHPSQHSSSAMVRPWSTSGGWKINAGRLRYMTVGNHDHSLNREWHQVEFSALEPRWKLPCLTHSFNVSTMVSQFLTCPDCNKHWFPGHLSHVCVNWHCLHWGQ